jgi:hypothetical protein
MTDGLKASRRDGDKRRGTDRAFPGQSARGLWLRTRIATYARRLSSRNVPFVTRAGEHTEQNRVLHSCIVVCCRSMRPHARE